jgi:hypothetical protein
VISRNIPFAVLLALAAGACGEDDGAGDPPPPEVESACWAAQALCTGDTICGEAACERAFDRAYQVRVTSTRSPGKRDGECPDDRNCAPPTVTVHFSERDEPILRAPDGPAVAAIVVTEGSSLIVEIRESVCMIDLTPDRLRSGQVDCGRGAMSATLSVLAMQL